MLRCYRRPLALLATLLTCASATAGEIVFETRATTTTVTPWDALGSWNAQTSPISATQLLAFANVSTPAAHHHSRLRLQFEATDTTAWDFEFGLDAGLGSAVYLNGQLQASASDDRWWGNSWNAVDELLSLAGAVFMRGSNTIDVYWAENCCAGTQSGRFRAEGGQWQALTRANLGQLAIPEPGSAALLAAGVIAFAARRRARDQKPHVA